MTVAVQDFSGGWFVQRVHSARLRLWASCGTMSFLVAGTQDYVARLAVHQLPWPSKGCQRHTGHWSTERLHRGDGGHHFPRRHGMQDRGTGMAGDGSHDTDMDITSTLANLNLQLWHSRVQEPVVHVCQSSSKPANGRPDTNSFGCGLVFRYSTALSRLYSVHSSARGPYRY